MNPAQASSDESEGGVDVSAAIRPSIAALGGVGGALLMHTSGLALVAAGVAAAALAAGHQLMSATDESRADQPQQSTERWRFSALEADPEITAEIQCNRRPAWFGGGTKRYRGRVHCSEWWGMVPVDQQSVGLVQSWVAEAHLPTAHQEHGAIALRLVLSLFRLIAKGEIALYAPEVWGWERRVEQFPVVGEPVLSRPPLRIAEIQRSAATTLTDDEARLLSVLREAQEFHISDSSHTGVALSQALEANQLELTAITVESVLRKILPKTDIGYDISESKLFAPVAAASFAPTSFRDADRFGGSEALSQVGADQGTFVLITTRCVEILGRLQTEIRTS